MIDLSDLVFTRQLKLLFVFIFIAHGVALITRVRLKVVDWVTSINFNKGHLTFNIYLVNAIGLHGPNLISCKQKFREREGRLEGLGLEIILL